MSTVDSLSIVGLDGIRKLVVLLAVERATSSPFPSLSSGFVLPHVPPLPSICSSVYCPPRVCLSQHPGAYRVECGSLAYGVATEYIRLLGPEAIAL